MQVARLEARARNGGSLRFRKLRCLVIGKQARVRRYWQKCQVFPACLAELFIGEKGRWIRGAVGTNGQYWPLPRKIVKKRTAY